MKNDAGWPLYPGRDNRSRFIVSPARTAANVLVLALMLATATSLSGCGTQRASTQDASAASGVREELDEERGETLTIVTAPIVMARSRTDIAANVRDYVTLAAVQEDNSGRYATWLVAHQWSTVDSRLPGAGWRGDGRLVVIADARLLSLNPETPPPSLLQRRAWVYAPAVPSARSYAYAIDQDTLRYLAAARQIQVRFQGDPMPQNYLIWRDGRAALRTWLASVRR